MKKLSKLQLKEFIEIEKNEMKKIKGGNIWDRLCPDSQCAGQRCQNEIGDEGVCVPAGKECICFATYV